MAMLDVLVWDPQGCGGSLYRFSFYWKVICSDLRKTMFCHRIDSRAVVDIERADRQL